MFIKYLILPAYIKWLVPFVVNVLINCYMVSISFGKGKGCLTTQYTNRKKTVSDKANGSKQLAHSRYVAAAPWPGIEPATSSSHLLCQVRYWSLTTINVTQMLNYCTCSCIAYVTKYSIQCLFRNPVNGYQSIIFRT